MKTPTELKPDGFENERHAIVPPDLVKLALRNPVTRDLLPTAIGHFPAAVGHYIKRTDSAVIDDAVLLYCADGSGWFRMGGHTRRLAAGSALVIPPLAEHSYGTTKSKPWTIYWVHFNGARLPDYLAVLEVSLQRPVIQLENTGEVVHHFEGMYGLLINGYTLKNLVALSTALANFLGQITIHRRSGRGGRLAASDLARRTIPFMHRHLTSDVSNAELAEYAGLSASHYSAVFKSLTGMSPKAYYLKLKMEYAAHILETTHAPVKEVGFRLGISDPYYFSRLFKKIIGLSPEHFRKGVHLHPKTARK